MEIANECEFYCSKKPVTTFHTNLTEFYCSKKPS